MTGAISLLIAILLFVALALARVPIAFSLFAAGSFGLILQEGLPVAMSIMANQPYRSASAFTLAVVPLFIALGVFVKQAGVAEQIYATLSRWLGRLPGGLALATVAACAVFAAVSGSSTATVAMVGKIGIHEMTRAGYDKALAAGVVSAAGTLGILIPPSIALVLFAIIVGESVSALLLAGIVPGVLSAVAYAFAIVIWQIRRAHREARVSVAAQRHKQADSELANHSRESLEEYSSAAVDHVASPRGLEGSSEPAEIAIEGSVDSTHELPLSSTAAFFIVGIIFVAVIGGIYTGTFTTVEAASVGALLGFTVLSAQILRHAPREFFSRVSEPIRETVSLTTMIFAIFIGAALFNDLLIRGGIPSALAGWAEALPVHPLVVVAVFLLVLIPLGMVLDGMAMLLIVAPLAYPVVTGLGFSGIWFGILFIKMIEIGLVTPPLGLNIYVVAGVSDEITVADAFRGVSRFALVDLVVIALLFAFPALVTFVPTAAASS